MQSFWGLHLQNQVANRTYIKKTSAKKEAIVVKMSLAIHPAIKSKEVTLYDQLVGRFIFTLISIAPNCRYIVVIIYTSI